MKKYYKATYDMKCQDMIFAVGETYTISTKLEICKTGFHFCENAPDVLSYYPIKNGFMLLEVSPLGEIVTIGNKSCTNSLKILRIIPKEEAEALLKTDWEYDSNNNLIHSKNSSGIEYWYEYDSNNNVIHFKDSSGYEFWNKYDSNNNLIHYKNSSGNESWYDSTGNQITKQQFELNQKTMTCENKVVEIDGVKYKLILV